MLRFLMLAGCLAALTACGGGSTETTPGQGASGLRWWKGNTHTHTLWSDGNGAPELVTHLYHEQGYDFLVLSDHNVLSRGEKWFPIDGEKDRRLPQERVDELASIFGADWVVERERDGRREMRLKTLEEVRARFESPDEFLLIEGEEITDSAEGVPVHLNALNLADVVPPQKGATKSETLQNDIDAALAQADEGRRVVVHINHPNFGWALEPDDMMAIRGGHFFEIYNGHRGVQSNGDAEHLDTEALWDRLLARRLGPLDAGPMYGVATDDAHHYFDSPDGVANPGRGWIMVRAAKLDANSLLEAVERGDFYATTGVRLEILEASAEEYRVEVTPEAGIRYTIEFLGTRRDRTEDGPFGEVLSRVEGSSATYRTQGDELYVRARITSTRLHDSPFAPGDMEMAWTQPVAIPAP